MRWGILGPLQVTDDTGTDIALPGGRVRVLLAALLTRANHAVSIDELSELLWDGEPPSGAARTVQVYVVRLRRALGPDAGTRIVTRAPGYLYQCPPGQDELDLPRFESLCRAGSAALRAEDWTRAAALLAEASGLWRGTPLAEVPSESLRRQFVPRIEQLHLQALEDHIEAGLRLGRAEQVVPHVRELAAAHPLRERFHAQLITALAVGGRRAEALTAYQQARRVLVDELGLEPGPELRTLHERILAGESDPIPPQAAALRAPTPSRAVPRQLPTAVRHFTGRQVELDMLTRLLDETDVSGGTVVISAIDGMAGIGKTALAVHSAHRLAEKFPDGQLFLDLHGYTQGHPARTADEALTWLLHALGVPPERIPTDSEQAAALYRQRLADTRTLILLDNAATEAQVRPLLPGTGSCLVLVTSRRRLKALDDAHIMSLDVLAPSDAIALLRAVAGLDRIPADDPLAGEIAELCGYLPLALRIAASLLRHRPTWGPEQLAGQLRDRRRRVSALSDGERELAAVFDLSYASLDAPHQQLWRRSGLVPGPDLDAYAAAALSECAPEASAGLLEDLVDHNLLTAYAPGRYRLHDLLRAHTRTLAEADPAPEREAAVDRLLHYYAHTARTAQCASQPFLRDPGTEPDGPAPAHSPALPDPDAARSWLRTEQPNLDAAFAHAHAHGLDEHAIALAEGLAEIMRADGPFTRALEIHRAAATTAECAGRLVAHATALNNLGRVQYQAGDLSVADDAHTRALEIFRALGDRLGEANALTNLARVWSMTGDYPRAEDALTRALQDYRALDHRLGEAYALTYLGRVRHMTGDHSGAGDALNRALEIYRALDHHPGEAATLNELGRVRSLTGDYPGANDAYARVLEINRSLGNRFGEANALNELGRVRTKTGDYSGANDAHAWALELYRALGSRSSEAIALTDLGRVRQAVGDHSGAGDALTRALEIYHQLGHRLGEAYGLIELGRMRQAVGDHPGAGDALTRALEIYRDLGERGNEAVTLNHYAATLAATGQRPRALELYQQALAMHRELNKPDDEAASLEGIAEHHLATGDPTQGAAHLHQALEIYQRLGMTPDTRRVENRLNFLATQ
jgi:DNA-binding SARP family transcriptional activator